MALNDTNVKVAFTGAVRTAILGTTAPATSVAVFGAGWVDLGYISEDGVTETPNAEWNEIRAWQGRTIVRRSLTSADVQWKFTMIESKQETLEAFYVGSEMSVAGTEGILPIVSPSWNPRAWALDWIDGTVHERTIIPKATVTERGDVVYNGEDAIGYEVTITAIPSGAVDASGSPIFATKYSDNPAWRAFSSA